MTRVLTFPKPTRLRDRNYLLWIRRQPCLVDGAAAMPHHIDASGMGTKCSDYRTVPLCFRHHRECHDAGRLRFEDRYRVDLKEEAYRLLEIYAAALSGGESA